MKNRSKYLDLKDGTLYFRRFKKRYGMLPGKRGSPEFNDAWDRYFAQSERDRAGRQAPQEPSAPSQPAEKKIGTVAYFIRKFLASEFFVSHHGKAPKYASGTIINYKAVLERMALDALPGQKEPIGNGMLIDFTQKKALSYLHKIGEHYRPAQARTQLSLLSNLWEFAMRFDEFDPGERANPFHGIGEATFYSVEQEHEPWPIDVRERFLAACDANLYFAFHLLLYLGQRVSDVCALKWSQYDGTCIQLTQIKTKKSNDPMRIRVPKVLKALLDKRERVHEHILTHKWGRPYSRDSLGHRIKDVLIANGDGNYTAHGLRKNAGIMLAENGRRCRRSWRRSATRHRSSRCTTRASPTKRCCPTKLPRSWTWWPHEKRTRRKPRPRRAAL